MKNIVVILISSLLLLSCASAGKKIELGMVHNTIKLNESTKDDVIQLLGEPLSRNFDAKNETEIWHYAYVKKNITGAGLLGHIVGIGAEWKTKTEVADFYFRDGIVIDIKSNSSDTKRFNLY